MSLVKASVAYEMMGEPVAAFAREERGAAMIFIVVMFVAHHTMVNTVRSAVRFLSRTDLSADNVTQATTLAEPGTLDGSGGVRGVSSATATVTTAYTTFTDTNFRENGQVLRVAVTGSYRPVLFEFLLLGGGGIPINVVEDMRHMGE